MVSKSVETPKPVETPKTSTVKIAKVKVNKLTSPKTKTIKLKWIKNKQVDGYQIQFAMNKKFTKSVKKYNVKKAKTTSKIVGKLKKGKTYYARVRGYKKKGSKIYYGSWSKILKVKCK